MSGADFDLTGRVIWVTGAGKGLGKAMALAIARAGGTLVATSRTAGDLAALGVELRDEGRDVTTHAASVADPEAVRATVGAIVDEHGRLDGLVNCAGISPSFERSERLGDETWDAVLSTNLTGTFYCCREAGAAMLAQGSGTIVNVSSIHASTGFPRIAAYAASKGGIDALTRTLAVEWADRGVRVNTLAPGYFETELSKPLLDSRWGEVIGAEIPMSRTGLPEELTGAVVFLMSSASSYMTGTTLTVDGGWTA